MAIEPALERSIPEAHGVDSAALRAFVEAADRQISHLHSLMLLRHGHVIAEGWWAPYRADRRHMLFSLSKSFTSTAIGLAVAEGRLSVDDPVLPFFPDEAPAEVGEHLAAMRIRHLLSMSTGHDVDTTGALHEQPDGNWARAFLARPVEHPPGTHFVYNSGATYMLSAIVQAVTGVTLLEYLRPRLLEPLGISGATWESCPRGINAGGWGMSIKTEDIARFGQLYLQGGSWQGRQLLPKAWVDEASAAHVSNGDSPESDWAQGYGYQFWRCRHGAYRGDGAFGQFCVVMPEQQAVLAITAGVADMQSVLNLVWEKLLPALQPDPLPPNLHAHAQLGQALASLGMPLASGRSASPAGSRISGKRYVFEPNEQQVESITLTFSADGCELAVRDERGEHRITSAYASWRSGATTLERRSPLAYAASGAWSDDETYVIQVCFYETPFCPTITCRFSGDSLRLAYRPNVSFLSTEPIEIVGRLAEQ